jgi:hypothetical protein
MTLSKFRSILYNTAKALGDVQAVTSKRKGAIERRVARRIAGKVTGRTVMKGIGGLFR